MSIFLAGKSLDATAAAIKAEIEASRTDHTARLARIDGMIAALEAEREAEVTSFAARDAGMAALIDGGADADAPDVARAA